MKTTKLLSSLLLSIPAAALAHPGHEIGVAATGLAGLSEGLLAALLALVVLCLAAVRIRRHRKAPGADG